MQKIDAALRVVDHISEWSGRLISFLVFPLVLMVVYEVTLRYLFSAPTLWAHDLSCMIFGTIFLIGGAYTLRHDAHVNVDILYRRLSPRGQAILDLFTYVFFFIFCGALFWKGIGMAIRSWQLLEVTQSLGHIPVYPAKTIIPLAALLILLQGGAKYIRSIQVVRSTRGGD